MFTFLLACTAEANPAGDTGTEQLPGDTAVDSGGGDTADSADTASDTGTGPEECGEILADPDAYAALFDPTGVHEIELTISEAARAELQAQPDSWADASLVVDGVSLPAIGVKWRGDSTQMRWDAKPSWSLGFRHGGGCDTFAGVERLTLDAMIDDPAQGRLVVEAAVLDGLGRVAPRVAFATLTVNGEAFGLFALVEYVDSAFVTNHLGSWAGVAWNSGSGADFTTSGLTAWDDVDGLGDIARLEAVAAVVQGSGDSFYAELGAVLDTDDLADHWAALAAIGDAGTFPYETDDANLLVPDDGLIRLVPDAPESGWDPAFDWTHVDSALGVRCVYDPACSAAIGAAIEATIPELTTVDAAGVAHDAFSLSAAAMADDPRRVFQAGAVSASRDDLETAIDAWPAALSAQVP